MNNFDIKNKTSNAFAYDNHFKIFGSKHCCGAHTDSKKDAPICVFDQNNRKFRLNMRQASEICFSAQCFV